MMRHPLTLDRLSLLIFPAVLGLAVFFFWIFASNARSDIDRLQEATATQRVTEARFTAEMAQVKEQLASIDTSLKVLVDEYQRHARLLAVIRDRITPPMPYP